MIRITLSFASGQRSEIWLAGVPRVGETIHLANGSKNKPLVVEHVLWMEVTSSGEPGVVVVVRPHD